MEEIVRIENLCKQYGGICALEGIDLCIQKGEIHGIIGLSGAGKSTLFRCLTCLERPSQGRILLNGIDLTTLSCQQLRLVRNKMGVIFQHFNLFLSRTALQNIAYPLEIEGVEKKERQKEAARLLSLVELQGKENHYPSQLSGGEKQRVAIARALAGQPSILLCDEATSALDPRSTQSILKLLSHLNQSLGLTILLITHEMEVIKQICTHLSVLEGGRIVEQGRVIDLFTCPRHPTTERFLQNLIHDPPEEVLQKREESELLHLFFSGKSVEKPIICQLIRQFEVDVNILLGGIDRLQTERVGNLVIALSGPANERLKAYEFLKESGVTYRRL